MEKKAEFEQLIAEKMAEFNVPGVSIGVLTADGPEYFTAGVTNIDHPLPVTADTLFQVGSNTCLLYTSPSPRDGLLSRMPSSA